MMKRYFFSFLLYGFITVAQASTWVIDRNVLEKRFSHQVNVDELCSVLEREGIKVQLEKREELVLWKGKKTFISLAASPFSPFHFWIAVEGKKTLDACTADELVELYEAIWRARKAVSQITGADGCMIFTTEQVRNGKENFSAGVEMIPAGFGGSKGTMDALEKDALNDYVFYNRGTIRNISYTPETLQLLREKLRILQPVIPIEQPHGQWSQKLLHHHEALHRSLESIHAILLDSGALIEGEMPSLALQEDKIHEIQINLDKCAFCNPKVIEKQIVCEWKDVYVLMSHKPTSPYGNFLILPKRHQCAWDLTQEEALASFEAVIALKNLFAETTESNNWICYIQDGPSVGQTVPHTHIHFYILPEPLKMAMTSLQHIHNQRPILSHEEMRKNCEEKKQLLLKHLKKLQKQ